MNTPPTTGALNASSPSRLPVGIMTICGGAIAFDGYDIVVYGTTLSRLRDEWGLTSGQAGNIGSAALVGMFLGALVVGTFAGSSQMRVQVGRARRSADRRRDLPTTEVPTPSIR